MTGIRCYHRKTMGSATDGGSVPPSTPCRRIPTAEESGRSEPSDLISHAVKALSIRSPFDTEKDAGRNPTLPAGVASFLSRHRDGRNNHRRSAVDPPSTASTVWDHAEEYFRPLTLTDIDHLRAALRFDPCCLSIPVLGNKVETFDTGIVEPSSVEQLPVEEQAKEAEIESLPTSTNWVLSSRHRFLLTSERPNKKRKLLAGDAGLDKLLQLPNSDESRCDVCCLGPTGVNSDQLLCCDSCKVKVHQKCYGISVAPVGGWLCSWCKHLEVSGQPVNHGGCLRPCLLCPREGGALKASGRDNIKGRSGSDEAVKFVHLFCSLWAPEVHVEDTATMEPVMNVGGIQETRTKLVCYLCKVKHGVCVRCSQGTCRTSFHPLCARESKHQMEIWGKFGCNNVELRAFCSKHSGPQDTVNIASDSSLGRPLSVVPPMSKFKIKLNSFKTDKRFTQVEIQGSKEMIRKENSSERDAVSGEAEVKKNNDTNGVNGSLDNTPASPDPAILLRKLIDRGKVNMDDVASDMAISTNSLEAALLGETKSFSPGLRLKIIKWLQDSVHMLKVTTGTTISSGDGVARVDGTNKVVYPSVPGLEVSDGAVIKSLPSQRRASSNRGNSNDIISQHPSAETPTEKNCNGKLVYDNSEIPVVVSEDMKGVRDKKSSNHNQDFINEGLKLLEMNFEGTANPGDSSPSLDPSPRNKGNRVKRESNDLCEAQHQKPCTSERVSTVGYGIDHADEADVIMPNILEKGFQSHPDRDGDVVVSCSKPDLIIGESDSSYVHPFIRRKLMQVQNHAISEHKFGEASFFGHNSLESVYCDQPLVFPGTESTDTNHALDKATVDQLVKAKKMGAMLFSPDDEVEAELLYSQIRLLDKTVTVKHSCEDLISRVVRELPKELDALNKRGWDLALVNQFLSQIKEAKKRSRKERKHKEAQAMVAATAAAVAAFSRNSSSLRKDANDESGSNHQKSPLKVSDATVRLRSSSPLVARAKESSRSTMGKISPENLEIFQMPDFFQENALSCDICKRAETMLNRISVCSICKVPVHLDCYRRLKNPIGPWRCELCEEITSQSRSPRNEAAYGTGGVDFCCTLCGFTTGALRKSTDGQWVHAFCAEWLLESRYKRGQQNPVEGMDTMSKELNLRSCSICHLSTGICLKCSSGHCQMTFHPYCARNAGLYLNIKANGARLQHKAYCEKHSTEQSEADNQHHGSDEIERIKQIRGELERVRLLCERIIKREKLKKELVVCTHDILASRRDYVAMSGLARAGVSSESATTSINNQSQRSDDITVDSTVSGENTGRVSTHTYIENKTVDGSASRLSKRNRVLFGGKQLPQKRASVEPLRNSVVADGGHRSKIRKQTQTFQKEVVMTSVQASMQNQRLPKGFVYVPVGSLSNEKPTASDLEPHEPPEPGG